MESNANFHARLIKTGNLNCYINFHTNSSM